jgi:hypothetical protein
VKRETKQITDGAVRITAGLRVGRRGVRIPARKKSFSSAKRPTQPPFEWTLEALSPQGIKWPGREVDHTHPSRAVAMN